MTPEQKTEFQNRLLAQRTALLGQISQQRGGVIGRAEAAADHFAGPEDSHAQLASAKDIEFALAEHETAELGAIDAALQRIADGSYGRCSDCGTPIAPKRLTAAPEASRCLACQTQAENAR